MQLLVGSMYNSILVKIQHMLSCKVRQLGVVNLLVRHSLNIFNYTIVMNLHTYSSSFLETNLASTSV